MSSLKTSFNKVLERKVFNLARGRMGQSFSEFKIHFLKCKASFKQRSVCLFVCFLIFFPAFVVRRDKMTPPEKLFLISEMSISNFKCRQ